MLTRHGLCLSFVHSGWGDILQVANIYFFILQLNGFLSCRL